MTAYPAPHHDPTDVVGSRIAAYIVDVIIMTIATMAVLVPLFMSVSVEDTTGTVRCTTSSGDNFRPVGDSGVTGGVFDDSTPTTADGPNFCFETGDSVRYIPTHKEGAFQRDVWMAAVGISAVNLVLIQGLTGASLGKMTVGLRVVGGDGTKLGFGRMIVRWVLLFVDAFCCVLPGLVLVFTTKGHRRVGDMAAASYVIKKHSVGRPVVVDPTAAPQGWGGPGFGAPPTAPGGGGGWGDPATGSQSSWTPQAPPASASGTPAGEAPAWDPARNAYIQYDREAQAWMQWDDDTRTWGPISQ